METRRVLREGGALIFAVWRTPDLNPWAAVPAMTLVQRGHESGRSDSACDRVTPDRDREESVRHQRPIPISAGLSERRQ